ncbi:YlqD family protein [Bacillus suaedaesalsae]|uniref:YlqD family protein n=1 Tax=Bacillus suaedaesalsae TaxID=2810349 RepID=A0ABS2DJ01_9BACI|nr:YlqD family protein [Bacillus suaedaesalsae]MBM6618470.1 YlqD family protein [Bacillus suaedaesalsae]
MEIIQTVIVKQILTELSKQQLLDFFNSEILQLKKECEQLQFEQKKLQYKKKGPSPNHDFFKKELNSREEEIKMLEFRLKQLHILPIGSEIKQKEVQAIIRVEVGNQWDSLQKTIIIKDGRVIEIR